MRQSKAGLTKDIAYGLISGLVGTFLMDKVTTLLYKYESEATKKKESSLMKEPAYVLLARRVAEKSGFKLTDRQAATGGSLLHWTYGITWGGVYGALHDRVPAFTKAGGLLYGISVFALGDEGLNTALRLSPPPRAFPLAVHLRGLVGHIVYAVTSDGTYRLLKAA